jgi:hypothetical protein
MATTTKRRQGQLDFTFRTWGDGEGASGAEHPLGAAVSRTGCGRGSSGGCRCT